MKELFNYAMDIGEQMLIAGAEVHRAEDSVRRMCLALGAVRADVFIITSSMVATVHTENGDCFTESRRITKTGTNIEKLHRLNDLSRRICAKKADREVIEKELAQIIAIKSYPFWVECIAYSLIAGTFTLFFGGTVRDMIVSLIVGLLLKFVVYAMDKTISNQIFSKCASTFLACIIASFAVKIGFIDNIDMVIIGNIMTLIPGIGLTTALRDLFTGDSIAGLLRSIEAALTAIAIAAGYFLCMLLVGGV